MFSGTTKKVRMLNKSLTFFSGEDTELNDTLNDGDAVGSGEHDDTQAKKQPI